MKYVIANWKANKMIEEANKWVDLFSKKDLLSFKDRVTIIICPPFSLIPLIKEAFSSHPVVKVGAQDISFYHAGSYTGEVAAHTLSGLVEYTIIGHSERRKYFHETDAIVEQKSLNALDFGIKTIFCVRGAGDQIPEKVSMIAYEPVEAIGTGENESSEKVLEMRKRLPLSKDAIFIYGGSVNSDNAPDYMMHNEIDGFLVGGASLDPEEFYAIAKACI